MSDSAYKTSQGLGAAGDLLGGIGAFVGGAASADKLKATAKRVQVATAIRLVQQQRQGYLVQGTTQANIGAQGWQAGSGSAADIVRMNASNLALDHGIIQAQGSELASQYTTAASASLAAGWSGLIEGVVSAGSKAALM